MKAAEFDLDGYRFGCGHVVDVLDWDLGMRDVRVQDVPVPGGDGVLMGRDLEGAPEWVFTLRARDAGNVLTFDAFEGLRRAWQKDLVPGQMVALRYGLPGRERCVFGRPRRWVAGQDAVRHGMHIGRMTALASFQLSDVRSFSDAVSSVSIGLIPESSGGLIFPLVFPLTSTVSGSVRAGFVESVGNAPAPVVVTFYGPVTNPRVYAEGWEIGLTGSLAYDESVTVDALALTVENQSGASVGGRLTRATRLRKAVVPPGQSEVFFTGGDSTGTARVDISWRDAYYTF